MKFKNIAFDSEFTNLVNEDSISIVNSRQDIRIGKLVRANSLHCDRMNLLVRTVQTDASTVFIEVVSDHFNNMSDITN